MSGCPSSKQLQSLLHEQLREPELTVVAAHVEDCAHCQETLNQLAGATAGIDHANLVSALSDMKSGGTAAEAEDLLSSLKKGKRESTAPPPIDGYQVLEEIGRGAAGVVYRARHLELNRLVALKMILAGAHLSSESRGRLRREAQAIARLQHPNIIQIYSVGEAAGCPFLALELVDGTNLAQWLGGRPRPAREAAQILATLALAVEYAHQHGVIHRDLKPGNILVSGGCPRDRVDQQADGLDVHSLKITDFGLAKLLSEPGIADAEMTRTGAIMGTPAYVAPEQARGDWKTIGPAVDIYSLGVILYELITGRPPFQGPTSIDTLLQAAHQEPVPPIRLVPKVPRDLQTICLKCLEKSPDRRYASAAELAADLERFLSHKPILARPVGWLERAARWVRRHRSEAAWLAAVALLLTVLVAGSLSAAAYYQQMESQQHQLALDKSKLADDKSRLADEKELERGRAVAAENRETQLRQAAEVEGEKFRHNLYFSQMNQAAQASASPSGLARTLDLLKPWQPALWNHGPHDLRQWEWYYLFGLCHRDKLTLSGYMHEVRDVAYHVDGRQLAAADADGTVHIWDVEQQVETHSLRGHLHAVNAVAWSPCGERLATASADGTVKIWTTDGLQGPATLDTKLGEVMCVAWSPEGNRLALGGKNGTLQVWNSVDASILESFRAHDDVLSSLAWHPDGGTLATASHDRSIRLWYTKDWLQTATFTGHSNWVNKISWSPDGSRLASASNDCFVKIWTPHTNKRQEILTLAGHAEAVLSLAWSPDGAELVTGSIDRTSKTWNATNGRERSTLRGHTGRVTSVAWSRKNQLATGGVDGTIKLWLAAAESETIMLRDAGGRTDSLAWSADGRYLASADMDGTIRLWNPQRAEPQVLLVGHNDRVRCVAWHPSVARLASGSTDHTIRIWDAASGQSERLLEGHTAEVFSVSWKPDGTQLASAGADATVRTWDAQTGEQIECLRGHDRWVHSVAWSPDGNRLACGSWDQTISIWDLADTRNPKLLRGHQNHVTSVAWSPNGDKLVSGGIDETVRLWNATTGNLLTTLQGHTAAVQAVAWSPDGKRIASAGSDNMVKLWDPTSGNEALSLRVHPEEVYSVAWSPDGSVLASAGFNHGIVLNDASPGYRASNSPGYLPTLDRELAAAPNSVDRWRARAEIHLLQGAFDAAAADASRNLELDRTSPWFIAGTWVAGPYPLDTGAHEAAAGSDSNGASHGQRIQENWQSVPRTVDGFVDFGPLFGRAENICADALCYVYSPTTQPATILLGSDDQAAVSLNGKSLYESIGPRSAKPESDVIEAELVAGWNRIVVRVANFSGDHMLFLRLSSPPLTPLTDSTTVAPR